METASAVLMRLPIPPGQLTLFKALYEAGDRGLMRGELAEQMRWGDNQSLKGVLGALGRRINGTKGLDEDRPGITFFLVVERRPGGSHYTMSPRLRRGTTPFPHAITSTKAGSGGVREHRAPLPHAARHGWK